MKARSTESVVWTSISTESDELWCGIFMQHIEYVIQLYII